MLMRPWTIPWKKGAKSSLVARQRKPIAEIASDCTEGILDIIYLFIFSLSLIIIINNNNVRSSTQTRQPLHDGGKHVLEDLLRDHLTVAELTQSRGDHSLHTQTRLLLKEIQQSLDHLSTTLLLEHTSKRGGEEGKGLDSHEHHTRMS